MSGVGRLFPGHDHIKSVELVGVDAFDLKIGNFGSLESEI
jgi:hypothetical protein